MTFAGVIAGCWLTIAGLAFLAISGLGRLAARGDVDSDLGIVGEAELRMLVGHHTDGRQTGDALHAMHPRLVGRGAHSMVAMSAGSGARKAHDQSGWAVGDRSGHDYAGFAR